MDAVQRILAIAERERRKRQYKALTNQIATKSLKGKSEATQREFQQEEKKPIETLTTTPQPT